MIKIAFLGIAAAMLAAWIKTIKSEYSLWILFAAGGILAFAVTEQLLVIVEQLKSLGKALSSYGEYVRLLVKIIGITYLSELSSDLCKDAGAAVLGGQVELFGKLSILVLCLPVFGALLGMIHQVFGG